MKRTSQPLTGEQLYESAVRALARRGRSSGEMRQLLARKKATKAQIEEILHRLRQNGYLDDARFARQFAAARLEDSLHGKARVRRDLAVRRMRPDLARQAIEAAYEGVNETELLRRYMERKVRLSQPPTKPSAVAALYRRLLRAGFCSATIVQELKRIRQSILAKGRGAEREPPSWDELLESLAEIPDAIPEE